MPVTVDTPLCVADQTTFMTVVGKHKPREGGRMPGRERERKGREEDTMEGGREGGREEGREGGREGGREHELWETSLDH